MRFDTVSKKLQIDGYVFTAIKEDSQGYIWLGTARNGVFRVVGNEAIQFSHDYHDEGSVLPGYVYFIEEDENGRLWVGTESGINLITLTNLKISELPLLPDDFSPFCKRSYTYIPDGEGGYWIGTGCGLVHMDSLFQTVGRFPVPEYFDGHKNTENIVYSLLQDTNDTNRIWVGTRYGLKSFDKQTETYLTHPNLRKWHSQYPDAQQYAIYAMIQTAKDDIWMTACWSGGLLNYHSKDQAWRQYLFPGHTPEHPNWGNSIVTLTAEMDSVFVYGNDLGPGIFDLKTQEFNHLNSYTLHEEDGFQARHMVDQFGMLWAAGKNGVYKTTVPLYQKGKQNPIAPVISEIVLNNQSRHAYLPGALDVPLDSNNIHIKLLSVNHPGNGRERYRWQLKGQDRDWKYGAGPPVIEYDNVATGNYELVYEVEDLNGQEWVRGLPLQLSVIKPFYQQLWFILLLVTLVGCFVYYLMGMKVKRVRKEEKVISDYERQLAEIKMSALNSQMNPHFMFNTMNSINHYILKNDSMNASRYLSRFSRLIRQVLHNSRHTVVPLVDELNAIELYVEMEQLRFDGGFAYETNIDPDINQDKAMIPPMLFQPYIENAIWHGLLHKKGNRILSLRIRKRNGHLVISIRDNGIGREASQKNQKQFSEKRKSVGMSIAKDRVSLVNDLYHLDARVEVVDHVEKHVPAGTEIILTLPIIYDKKT